MKLLYSTLILLPLLLLLLPILASCNDKQVYIVYFGEHNGEKAVHEIEETHHSYLQSVKESEEDAKSSLLYSYKHSINGFAAVLSPDEASKLSELEEVVSVYPSDPRKYSLQTTRSWEFAGLKEIVPEATLNREDLLLKSSYGKNVIIGILDSGLWPESESFKDDGLGPIPKSWKGICQSGDAFDSSNCNKKIIGAKYYLKGYESYYGPLNRTLDYKSPRDKDGHGTHTSSTAGGRRVENVSALGGFAQGIASGGAPLARLAMYKVCWAVPAKGKEDGNTCFEEDMLAAIDDAIRDGVDVISISIGTNEPTPFNQDSIAIGALHAVKKNIVVSCSAGNSGPAPATLSNTAPWIMTVGASSVDRAFSAPLLHLVYAGQVVKSNVSKDLEGQCLPDSLSLGNSKANGAELAADAHLLPATAVDYETAQQILEYIESSKEPKAYIFHAHTVLNAKPAPPDITAPGLNILAAWSGGSSPTKLDIDRRVVQYNILSGTSMSCPHVGGATALLKAIHPDWSSAAIRSALITSAGLRNNVGKQITDANGSPADPFQFGGGHFRPSKAADPGLVYDASYTDYLLFLCAYGVKGVVPSFKCPENAPSPSNLNYPSVAIPELKGKVTVKRTVTNVGSGRSLYFAKVQPPSGFSVEISPPILYFTHAGQTKSFTVTVKARRDNMKKSVEKHEYEFGWFTWNDGLHNVRSPIAVSLA